MEICRIKNIFVGIISTMAVVAGALNGCGQAANPAESAPEQSSVEASVSEKQFIGIPSEDNAEVDKNRNITIRIASWYKESYLTNLKEYLSIKFPEYKFEFLYLEKNNYESLMDDQLATKSAPDIVCVDPTMTKKHAKNGYLMNLTEITEGFSDVGKKPFTYNGKVYAVPNTCNYECFYYNKGMFDENNISVPENFTEFMEMCAYFQQKENIKPLAAGLKDEITLANSGIIFANAGYFTTIYGSTFGDRVQFGKASFYKELRDDLKNWEFMVDHGVFTKDMYLEDKEAVIEEFAEETAAVLVGEPADYNRIKELNPDIEVGVFVIVDKSKNNCPIIGGNDCGFAVNVNSKQIREAKVVVTSLATLSGQSALWGDRVGSQTYLADVKFQNPECFDPVMEMVQENRLETPYYTWGPHSRELYQIFARELQQVLVDRKTLEFALQDLDRQAQIIREEE